MKKINLKNIKETLYHQVLPNGLDVYLMPKKDYNKTYVTLTSNFGAYHTHYYNKHKELKEIIPGTAHFLEHKIFELPDGSDAFMRLSNVGASSNAFTSHLMTSYLFSCTANLMDATQILFDFVFSSCFNDESTNREKGIISEEIKMYQDYPEVQLQNLLIKNMYEISPILNEVAGTISDIMKIDANHLTEVYNNYYHPSNMQFFAIGNFDEAEYLKQIEEYLTKFCFVEKLEIPKLDYSNEPKTVIKKEDELKKNVNIPNLLLGIKLEPIYEVGDKRIKQELLINILLNLIIGESSQNYENLLDKDLISDDFESYFEMGQSYAFGLLSGSTMKADVLKKELVFILTDKKLHNFDENDFIRIKKQMLGKFIMSLNSLENIASNFTRYSFLQMNYFNCIEVLENIEYKDILNIQDIFNEENISVAILN